MIAAMTVQPGARATIEATVTDADSAIALGSGDVPVLGTPRVLALAEQATLRALAGSLPPGQTTVGARVELDHLRASRIGARVRVHATLVEVKGRKLLFRFELTDAGRLAAGGTVTRVLVDRDRFVEAAGPAG